MIATHASTATNMTRYAAAKVARLSNEVEELVELARSRERNAA